nr:myosin-2 heavy chain-like [Nicotiana tomentosiformis]
MDEVEAPCLFNEAQQALNRLTEKRDAYKLLSEKLQAELKAVRKEHADLVEQVQKKLDQIEQLQAEVDTVKDEAEEWKGSMDRLASEKETARAQLASTEVQLRAAKEKALELEVAKSEIVVVKPEADEKVDHHKADAEVAQDQVFEDKARKLAYLEEEDSEGSEDSRESKGGGDPEGDDESPDKD